MTADGPGAARGGTGDDGLPDLTCHAVCLLLGEAGVLIRGPSGSGKTTLGLELLDRWDGRGLHARLVGDDRIRLGRRHGRLVGRPHPRLAGLVEIRGLGIRRLARTAPAAVIRLVVDLVETRPRLPEEAGEADAEILGIGLPRLALGRDQPRAILVGLAREAAERAALQHAATGGSVARRTHPAAQWGEGHRDP